MRDANAQHEETQVAGLKRRGRGLSDADRAAIEQLVAQGFSSGRIAQRLNRHSSTVSWFLYSHGFKAPGPTPEVGRTYQRNGQTIRRWSRTEEVAAIEMRKRGMSFRAIAAAISEQFHTHRNQHSVRIRLIMVATREEDGE